MSPKENTKEWWKALSAADKAELRRAKSLAQVLLTRAANQLRWSVKEDWRNPTAIALIAGVLAHVRDNIEKPVPVYLGSHMSELRFRRLIGITDRERLLRPMIRAIRLSDSKADVAGLAESLYWWNDITRREWAYQYYSNHKEVHA